MRPLLHLATSSASDAVSGASPRALTDAELLSRIALHDTRALEVVLERYWPLVVDFTARVTGSLDAADDVAQRTFCQLWDRRGSWRVDGSLRALLCRIARNYAITEYRRDIARDRSAATYFEMQGQIAVVGDDQNEASNDMRCRLIYEIGRLPVRRREILLLRCVHELSYREIAEVLGIAEQTVANQVSRGLARLRESMDDLAR